MPEGNKLVIQGVQDRGEDKKEYLHKGIGARNFTRTFALTEDVKVVVQTLMMVCSTSH